MEIKPLNAAFKQFFLPPDWAEEWLFNIGDPSLQWAHLPTPLPLPSVSLRRPSQLELVLGTTWLPAGRRSPWWMLKELTPWPMSQRANNTASKVLCQVEYWFHVPCTLDTSNSKLPPSVLHWKKFNRILVVCFALLLRRQYCKSLEFRRSS